MWFYILYHLTPASGLTPRLPAWMRNSFACYYLRMRPIKMKLDKKKRMAELWESEHQLPWKGTKSAHLLTFIDFMSTHSPTSKSDLYVRNDSKKKSGLLRDWTFPFTMDAPSCVFNHGGVDASVDKVKITTREGPNKKIPTTLLQLFHE